MERPEVAPVTWTDISVAASRRGQVGTASVAFACAEECTVRVRYGDDVSVTGHGDDLFDALASARRALELEDVVLSVQGARRNVYPSAMQRQSVRGRRAYVLVVPRNQERPLTVDIFDPVSDTSSLTTVDDQRAFFDRWSRSGSPVDGGGTAEP